MNGDKFTFDYVNERFPPGTLVASNNNSDNKNYGEVKLTTRCDITGNARLLVRWSKTGIVCQVNPSQIVVVS